MDDGHSVSLCVASEVKERGGRREEIGGKERGERGGVGREDCVNQSGIEL